MLSMIPGSVAQNNVPAHHQAVVELDTETGLDFEGESTTDASATQAG